jgi:hypothetical protein
MIHFEKYMSLPFRGAAGSSVFFKKFMIMTEWKKYGSVLRDYLPMIVLVSLILIGCYLAWKSD